jgi:CheY-like chemotaxis protein
MITDPLPDSNQSETPLAFVEKVKQVLAHLYDFPYLQTHPLSTELIQLEQAADPNRGQALRRVHLEAIETLNPGEGVHFGAAHARPYNLLHLHYVEAMTIQECAEELNISTRQAYRDLRRAEASVAAILWEKYKPEAGQPRATQLSSLQKEMERLEPEPKSLDLCLLLRRVQSTIERLAQQRAVPLQLELPGEPVVVVADVAVAQQVLTNVWSHAVQHAMHEVAVSLARQEDTVTLTFCYQTRATAEGGELAPLVQQLTEKLGWRLAQGEEKAGAAVIQIEIRVDRPTVLVIDDNQGLVELLKRYLTDRTCRVVSAMNGRDGLRLAQEMQPDAIILDVMMPEIDGWEVLQLLRARAETAITPVIICSVFNDPELAISLGADVVLAKPVSRNEVLIALHQLSVVP